MFSLITSKKNTQQMCPMHPMYYMGHRCPMCSMKSMNTYQMNPNCPCASREGFEPEIDLKNKISFTDYLNNVYKQQFRK